MAPPSRMTANPARPMRHFPGKRIPAAPEPSSEESSESSEEEEERPQPPAPKPRPAPPATSFPTATLQVREQEKQRAEEEKRRFEAEFETDSEGGSESGSGSEESDGSSEGPSEDSEGEGSSDDSAPRKMPRPMFIKKNQRKAAATASAEPDYDAEQERKATVATAFVEAELERGKAEKAARKKQWDDDDSNMPAAAVDDTDGLDPTAEHAAWRLRELQRIKWEHAAIASAEAERDERERRRNLTEAEREAEDAVHTQKQRDALGQREGMAYMQKYFHRGAFYQDIEDHAALAERDVMTKAARFQDATDRSALPEYMQVRDQSKIGRKGRTKHKTMLHDDTGRPGDYLDKPNWGGRNDRIRSDALDARFQPGYGDERFGPAGGTGANAGPLGGRKRLDAGPEREAKRQRVDGT